MIIRSGDGGLSRALQKAQENKTYGKGLWLFWGVRFEQTSIKARLDKPRKWLCIGVPREACDKLKVPFGEDKGLVTLRGCRSRSGVEINQYESQMTRRHILMFKGGIAPLDAWEYAEDRKGGLL